MYAGKTALVVVGAGAAAATAGILSGNAAADDDFNGVPVGDLSAPRGSDDFNNAVEHLRLMVHNDSQAQQGGKRASTAAVLMGAFALAGSAIERPLVRNIMLGTGLAGTVAGAGIGGYLHSQDNRMTGLVRDSYGLDVTVVTETE